MRRDAALDTRVGGGTLLDRLRVETAHAHDRVERDLDWRSRVATLAGYRALLARWWGLLAAVEPRLDEAFSCAGEAPFFQPRRKLPLLERDLLHLGLTRPVIGALPVCPWRGSGGVPEALGTLYVLEGATLGGQVVARHLREAHGASLRERGCAFYTPYGQGAPGAGATGAMWRATRARLLAGGGADADDRIVASALDTFARVRGWLVADSACAAGGGLLAPRRPVGSRDLEACAAAVTRPGTPPPT